MMHIVEKESSFNPKAVGDTHLTCKRTGERMRSRGLVQINDCYWPDVSDREAHNPDFALRFLAEKLKEGKCRLWSTCPIS